MPKAIKTICYKRNSGYLERTSCIGCGITSCIGCGIPAAGDHLISRLEAAPTGVFFMVTWTFRISAKEIKNGDDQTLSFIYRPSISFELSVLLALSPLIY
jgi:hypothetical protein